MSLLDTLDGFRLQEIGQSLWITCAGNCAASGSTKQVVGSADGPHAGLQRGSTRRIVMAECHSKLEV